MKPKAPTVKAIDEACRQGFAVYTGNRDKGTDRPVAGARTLKTGEIDVKGRVWINMEDDYSWHYIEASEITITNEPVKRRKDKSMATGKRRAGAPSHLTLAASKKAATQSKTQNADQSAKDEPEGKSRASFTRSGPGKQAELPGVTTGERRSPEIEEAAERWEETKLAKAKAVKAHQEADDILVTVMRKKKRTHYSRSTFGAVTVPEPSVHAKFVREKQESAKPKSRKK